MGELWIRSGGSGIEEVQLNAFDELHFITARLAEKWMVKEYEENRKRY